MRSFRGIDLRIYLNALGLLVRHPQIVLAPLAAAVINVLLLSAIPAGGGFLGFANSSILSLIAFVIDAFGLGVAIVAADSAWRYGRAPLDDAVRDARRRGGDILIAAIGFSFLVSVAGYVGAVLGGPGSLVLTAAAFVLCIYMLPAAAIGGVPGGATLQISGERVRTSPATAILIAAVYFAGITLGPPLALSALGPLLFGGGILSSGLVVSLIVAAIKAVFSAYVALVLAKAYADASYGRYLR